MQIGQTDTTSLKCVINSVSQFIHLVSCQTVKSMPFQKNCINMVGVLKRLKSVLDDEAVEDYKVPSDENLCKECEELDRAINEAADFMEKWSPKRSKILGVLQSGALLMKMQSSSLEIFHMIFRSLQLQASPPTCVFQYMQEVECLKKEPVTDYIEDALRYQRENSEPCNEHLKKIIELLGLTSNQELLKESIAVEQERLNAAEVNKMNGKLDEINQIVILVCNIRDYAMETELPQVKSAVLIPPYFRCPLSLELMSDPVIVASGQTYERLSIQKWLDHGLTICPKTRMRLTHTTLIPNYTVKSMIATWCEKNDVKLPSKSETNGLSCAYSSGSSSHRSDTDSTSRSSLQTGNAFDQKQKGDISSRLSVDTEKYEQQQSPAPSSYIYSRSESFSSSVSSTDCVLPVSKEMQMRGMSNKHENLKELSKGNTNGCPASPANRELEISDELTTTLHASKLVEDLYSKSNEVQTRAAEEIRLLTKHNKENRIIIGQCGVTIPLLSLLYSDVKITQEHAVTALLNLSINDNNKGLIMEAGAIEPLVHVLKTGNDGAKENSAASLFSLSVVENNKAKIGHSGAVKALVDLLGSSGTLRGKKDAATALYNLSICHENKARIVQTGAVKYLVQLMEHIGEGMVDKAVALLANLSTIAEGRLAIAREGGIPLLVEIVESGSRRGKENAASILLQLCLHNSKYCTLVLQEGAVPPLVALSQSGTPRAKEKAQQLLSHFRNQREGATGKGKS